ncbi:MAG: protease modulator HflC [Deltaproteobacteria bacterium]|nr:protease modulator HflC [Deltaproteobacteria bacterium]
MKKIVIYTAAVSALILILYSSLFIVKTDQYCIITRFGKVVKTIEKAGPFIKIPYPIEHIKLIDKKLKVYQPVPLEVFLQDDQNEVRNITLGYYLIWSISDPLKYYETLRDEGRAISRLEDNLGSFIKNRIGQYSLDSFLSTDQSKIKTKEISRLITEDASRNFSEKYGINVKKIDINRIILPEQNKNKVFERMVAERIRISNRYRAEGEEQAKIIISEANREKSILLSEANYKAKKIIAEAEAEAAAIYVESYNKNPDFYKFWRNLKSYEEAFSKESLFILSSDDPLLKIEGSY